MIQAGSNPLTYTLIYSVIDGCVRVDSGLLHCGGEAAGMLWGGGWGGVAGQLRMGGGSGQPEEAAGGCLYCLPRP